MTDWKELANQKAEAMMTDLSQLIAIPSVRDDSQATEDAPLGPGPKDALLKVMDIFKRDGFKHENLKNIVGYAEYGTEESDDNYVALLGHVDVMPAGDGWETDPFTPVIKDGRLYARGSSDDKGPTMAAYYGLKIVQELGLPLKHKVRFIVGTDEENDWTGMDYYFQNQPQPLLGFSPDADYPIINGEKGLGQYVLNFTPTNSGNIVLEEFTSGLRTNMVPGTAKAVLSGSNLSQIADAFANYLSTDEKISGDSQLAEDKLTLNLVGKQAHGAFPEHGDNAATYLANFLSDLDFGGDAKFFLELVGKTAHKDPEGVKMGIASEDPVMGKLSFNIGILRFVNNQEGLINVNIRYPKSTNGEIILGQLNDAIPAGWDVEFEVLGHNQEPHYVDPSDSVVTTLLDIYHTQTGLPAHDQVIGGGTYGRLMERGVAFGALFPDAEDTMHQANEYMRIDDLIRSMAIYAESIYKLANLD
ncbi:MAG: dipeptidase PepV [Lactobacillaceae bacterium]|jgi:D-alanyl-D-alanine dipeptidase|nr:dipeptidase PepV [Lactobacillaceae bacterium]